jgi:hypothetical protein
MNNKLKKWMEKNKPGENHTSFLHSHLEEIRELLKNGYTQNQIVQFLRDVHNVETTRQNLSFFLKRHLLSKKIVDRKKEIDINKDKDKFDELDKKFGHLV